MNRELLLQHFNRISEAPDAIPRLRRFILDLAVRGKLVEQDPNDEPAAELLKRIQAEKERLGVTQRRKDAKKGKNGVDSLGSLATWRETAFDLPVGWEWVRLGEICSKTGSGSTPKGGKDAYLKAGVPFLRSQNVYDDGLRLHGVAYISDETHRQMQGTAVLPDDLLLNITGGSIGRCAHVPKAFTIGNINQHVAILRLALIELSAFTHTTVLSPYFQNQIFSSLTGAGREGLPKNKMDEIVVPLPPLAEQQRIVAKVDELMALCDQLEAERNQRESHRDKLVAASLQQLQNLDSLTPRRQAAKKGKNEVDPLGSLAPWREIAFLQNFQRLTTKPEHIKQLRQTILNLAVRGKLVEQDPNDEPAGELLKRIQAEKERLVKEGKIRKQEELPVILIKDHTYEAPCGWSWARLGNVSRKIHYGYTASANQALQDVRLLRITDIQDNSVDWSTVPGCEIPDDDVDQYKLEKSDILIARTGGTIGKTFLVDEQPPVTSIFASYLIRVQGSSEVYDKYLKMFLESPVYWTQLQDGARGAGQPNVNGQTLGKMHVPLPPLAEQHRIVAKVDELMSLCDQLETQLTTATADSRRLLEAVLRDALEVQP